MDLFVTSRRRSNVGHRAFAELEVAEADSRAGRHTPSVVSRGAFLMPLPVRELREARGAARPDHMDDLLVTGCPKKFADVQNALRRKFKFRTWKSTAVGKTRQTVGCCGAQISVTENEVQLTLAEYVQKIETMHFRVVPKMTVRRARARRDFARTSWIPAAVSNPRTSSLDLRRFHATRHRGESDVQRSS